MSDTSLETYQAPAQAQNSQWRIKSLMSRRAVLRIWSTHKKIGYEAVRALVIAIVAFMVGKWTVAKPEPQFHKEPTAEQMYWAMEKDGIGGAPDVEPLFLGRRVDWVGSFQLIRGSEGEFYVFLNSRDDQTDPGEFAFLYDDSKHRFIKHASSGDQFRVRAKVRRFYPGNHPSLWEAEVEKVSYFVPKEPDTRPPPSGT